MSRKGCAVYLLICLVYLLSFTALAIGVYKIGSAIIEPLIPDADAVEVTAPTTEPTTTGTRAVVHTTVDEKVDAKVSKVDEKTESTVTIQAEPKQELPSPTIGEVDAEFDALGWIKCIAVYITCSEE